MTTSDEQRANKLDESAFEELADQFAQEIRRGESPQIASYADRFPAHATAINRLFPVLEMMERNGQQVEDMSEDGLFEAEMAQLEFLPHVRKLGDYRIVREIGRGGMGIVFEAHQESLSRTVALKLLPSSAQFDARRQQRFQQEAQASAKLHHTNIVPVFGVGTHDDTSYFVMQYIEGQPLDNVLQELSRIRTGNSPPAPAGTKAIAMGDVSTIASAINGTEPSNDPTDHDSPSTRTESDISQSNVSASTLATQGLFWRNIAKIGIQVASALDHAHTHKTLHRDIKPSNLLIDGEGNTWVTDFGLAKYFESPDLTRTGEVVGTLRYMSPEQLNGKADERSDIFALGLTLYEMAALKPAYDATDRNQLMQQALESNPKRLRSVNPQVPKDLDTIIHKCITSEPATRYQSAGALLDDLKRFIAGEPVLARRINPMQRLAKWCRRRPAVASLIAALFLSLIAGVLGVSWQWHQTSNALLLANNNLEEAKRQTAVAEEHFKEAKRQTAVAQEHFQQARESVNRFFTVISQQRLLREPGFSLLRKELMQEALDYHKQFVAQYGDDDELKFDLAQSLYHIADIEGAISAKPENATALDEPIAIFSDLIEQDPDNPDYQLWLAQCLRLKSNVLQRFDLNKAMDALGEAIKVAETIRKNHPNAWSADELLAKSYQMRGLAYEKMDRATGKTDRSLRDYTAAFLVRQHMQQLDPNNAPNTIMLAELHRDLGITFRRGGQREKAVEQYNAALDTIQPLVEKSPDDVMARNALAGIANSVGFYYGRGHEEGHYDIALEMYEISRTQYQVLANRSPLVLAYQNGLARAALNAGTVYQVQGNLDKALEYREYASSIRERLVNQNPHAPHLRSSWAISLDGLGTVLREMGRVDEALQMHQTAREQHLKVRAVAPRDTIFRLRMIDSIVQQTRAHAAKKMFNESVADLESLDNVMVDADAFPVFNRAVEYTLVACKIGSALSPDEAEADDELDYSDDERSSLEQLKTECIQQAKSSFQLATERGFDVVRGIDSNTAFKNFSKEYPEGETMKNWVLETFGSDE